MLPDASAASYDAGHDPRLAEALVNSREAASIAAIAREVRAAIYAGEYQPDDRLPTRAELAKLRGVSAESITIVMRMLAAEGLVSSEQGRGTFVLARRCYRVQVSASGGIPDDAGQSAMEALRAAIEAEPAASGLRYEVSMTTGRLAVAMTIETGGLSQAVAVAVTILRDSLSGYGWDLADATVRAEPAPQNAQD